MSVYEAYAFYTKDGSGIEGVTVTCDVFSSSSGIISASVVTSDVGGGFYKCSFSAVSDDNYLFRFKTVDNTVDSKQIGALYSDKTEIPVSVWSFANRTLTSFGTLVDDIWSSASRTLTGYGSLISDIWNYATRSLTSGSFSPADVWNYSTRTLTSSGGALTASEVWSYASRSLSEVSVSDNHFPIVIHTPLTFETFADNSVTITGVSDEAEIWFTVKKFINEPDHKAIIQISKTGGLLRLNGKSPSDLGISATNGSLVIVDGNAIVSLTTIAAPVIYGTLDNAFTGEIKTKTIFGVETIITQMPVFVKQSVTHTT